MDFDVDSLKKMKQATVNNLKELMKKSELNSSETKAAVESFKLLERLCCEIEDCEMMENGYSQYSARGEIHASPRRYNITSYDGRRSRMSRGDPRMSEAAYCEPGYYGDDYMYADSMRSRRSSSRAMGPGYYADSMRNYSGHSIKDRAVACLEKEFGEPASDYEYQQLQRFIELIRSTE